MIQFWGRTAANEADLLTIDRTLLGYAPVDGSPIEVGAILDDLGIAHGR